MRRTCETLPTIVTWDDPSVYVQNASITDDSLAPDGHSTIYVLVPVPNQHESIVWDDIKADFRETIVKQLGKLGYDDIADHIVSRPSSHPTTGALPISIEVRCST